MSDMENLEQTAVEKAKSLSDAAGNIRDQVGNTTIRLRSKATDAWEDFIDLVRRHPGKALSISLATGVAIGSAAAKSRRRHSSTLGQLDGLLAVGEEAWDAVRAGITGAAEVVTDALQEASRRRK